MKICAHIFGSSLGKKYLMAASGAVLFLFVIAHLAGNLQVFLGPEALNRYGHFLQSNPELDLARARFPPADDWPPYLVGHQTVPRK